MNNPVEQWICTPAESPIRVGNFEQVQISNGQPEPRGAYEVHFDEESVAEVTVLSAPQTEDTITLESNEIPSTSSTSSEAIPGSSSSNTSQTEMAASSVSTESTAAAAAADAATPLMRPTRIIQVIARQNYPSSVEDGRITRRYVDLKYELIKKKVDFLRLKRERLMEEFDLRMKLLRTQLTFEEKKLLIFRKKYRR